MKIALVAPQVPPRWIGGTEIATEAVARTLAARGHDVHIVTREGGVIDGHGITMHPVTWHQTRFVGLPLLWRRIAQTLAAIQPDVIHAQTLDWGIGAVLAQRNGVAPALVAGRGSDVYRSSGLHTRAARYAVRHAAAVAALSDDMAQEIRHRFYDRPVTIIPNGVDTARFSPPAPGPVPVVLYIGSLRPVKGVDCLIDAFARVRARHPTAQLHLAGDGDERARLEARAAPLSACTFLGAKPNSDIPALMAGATLFVLPSRSEGLSLVLLEAMAAGLPIVATAVGGIPGIISEENGLLVPPDDSTALADALSTALADEHLRKTMSAANRRKAQQYSWDAVVDRLETCYTRMRERSAPA